MEMKVRKRLFALTMLTALVISAFSPIIYALDVSDEITEATQAEASEGAEAGAENAPAVSEETNIPELTTAPEASETPEVSEPDQTPATNAYEIGEEEVTTVVQQTVELSLYDLLGGFTETGVDQYEYSSDNYKIINSTDEKVIFQLKRSTYESYDNSDKTIHGKISGFNLDLGTVKNDNVNGEIIDFNSNSIYFWPTENFEGTYSSYLRDGDSLTEYQLTVRYTGQQSETLPFATDFSKTSIKQNSSDSLLSFTPDYDNRKFTIASDNADWLVFDSFYETGKTNLTNETVYLEYAKANYQYYLYNTKTKAVKVYRLIVTNIVTETPEETVTININKNNQWQAGTEVYQNGETNSDFQIVGAYDKGENRFELEWHSVNDYWAKGNFSFAVSGQNQAKNSFIEYVVWEDDSDEDHLIKIVANLDETTAETVQPKEFTTQLTKAEITDVVKEVNFTYNANRTETEYITFDQSGQYSTESRSTVGKFILLYRDSTTPENYYFDYYLDEVSPNVYSANYYTSEHKGKHFYQITDIAEKPIETINISATLDNNSTFSQTTADGKLEISTWHMGGADYFSNRYDLYYNEQVYDGIYSYQASDWEYSVSDEGTAAINLSKTIYQIRSYTDNNGYSANTEIVKIYQVNFTLEARSYEEKATLNIALSQQNNADYLENVIETSADGKILLRGGYSHYEHEGTDYRNSYDYYNVYTEALSDDILISGSGVYKTYSQYYADGELTSSDESGTLDGFVYAYDKKEDKYTKYPVHLTVDNTAVDSSTLTRKEIRLTADLSKLLRYERPSASSVENSYLQGETKTDTDVKAGKLTFNFFWDKYDLWDRNKETAIGDRIYLNYSIFAEKTDTNTYKFKYRDGVDVILTVNDDTKTNKEVEVSKLAFDQKTLTLKKGQNYNLNDILTASPSNATVQYFKYEISDSSVVSSYGGSYIYANQKLGTTTITATSVNGKQAKITIVVKNTDEEPVATEVNEDTGIKVSADAENILPVDASLKVTDLATTDITVSDAQKEIIEKVDTLTNGKFKLFDINLVNETEQQNVQPNGTITVYIPIPEGFNKDKVVMYHYDEKNNTREKINGWLETIDNKDYYVFYTNHFSYYVLEEATATDDEDDDEPTTSESNSSSSSSSEPVTSDSSSSSSSSSEPVTSESNSSSSSSSEPVTSEPSAEEPTTSETILTNSKTGVKVVGNVPDGALLEATVLKDFNNPIYLAVDKLLESRFELFEIHLQKDGAVVQPNGNVKVYLPIPTGFDSSKLKLYYFNEQTNQLVLINGFVDGDFYVFETNHFSYYVLEETKNVVASQKQTTNNLPNTGSKSTVSIEIYGSLIVLLILAFVGLKTKKS